MKVAMAISGLEINLENGCAVARVELDSTEELGAFERALSVKTAELMRVAELGGLRPTFDWWQGQGLWPRPDGGWTVLMRRAQFQGQSAPMPNGFRHPADGQRGRRG